MENPDQVADIVHLTVLRLAIQSKSFALCRMLLPQIHGDISFRKSNGVKITYPTNYPLIIQVLTVVHKKNENNQSMVLLLTPYMTFKDVKLIIKKLFNINMCCQILITSKGIMHPLSFLWEGNITFNNACIHVCEYSFKDVTECIHNKLEMLYEEVNFIGWKCPECTFNNRFIREGCEQCSCNRPEFYHAPDVSDLSNDDLKWLQDVNERMEQSKIAMKKNIENNLEELYKTANQPLVTNKEQFECCVCLMKVDSGEGVCLSNCLHLICKKCLCEYVKTTTTPEIKCPYVEKDHQCNQVISQCEIKNVCDEKTIDYLDRLSIRAAEISSASFHCVTPDCTGFCFFDMLEKYDMFYCNVCNHFNCINCRAQHEGKTCKEYQDDILNPEVTDENIQKTKELLKMLLQKGEAMRCPKCEIIITKRSGCDNIICSSCRTEICWCTKGYRRGPNGCKCMENGKKCHPLCLNCH